MLVVAAAPDGRRCIIDIRQSDLASYSRCAQQKHLYDQAKLGLVARPANLSRTVFGTVVHHALQVMETRHAQGLSDALGVAKSTFAYYWNPANLPELAAQHPELVHGVDEWLARDSYGGMRSKGLQALEDYYSLLKSDDGLLLALEISFRIPVDLGDLGVHHLVGTADRVAIRKHVTKPYLSIEDFKTGKTPTYLRHNAQFTAYCRSPETPVLLADMTWRPMGDLVVGDEIMAVDEEPVGRESGVNRRHWRKAVVQNTWEIQKDAYRISCSDGTEMTVGAGHRLLAQREGRWRWRTVEDIALNLHNSRRKSAGIKLARMVRQPLLIEYGSLDYMVGYVAGATLGDGCIRSDVAKSPYWQIALGAVDSDLLDRLRLFLGVFGISVNDFTVEPSGKGWQRSLVTGLRTNRRADVEQIQAMCDSPSDTDEYAAGWLAGLYDTDGGMAKCGTISFFQKDRGVLDLVVKRTAQIGFQFRSCSKSVELVGDRTTRVEFMAVVQPALQRKIEQLDGTTARVFGDVRVVAVEALGVRDLVDITTSTGTYIAQGFVNHNCWASTQREFWDDFPDADERWQMYQTWARRGRWIDLRENKIKDAGWRGPADYDRLMLALHEYVRACEAGIYPLSINGDNCLHCAFRNGTCGGVAVPDEDYGRPS